MASSIPVSVTADAARVGCARFIGHRRGWRPSILAISAAWVGLLCAAAILAPWIAPHDPVEQFRDHLLQAPVWNGGSAVFALGTDDLGRDILSRLLHGARLSLFIGFFANLSALTLGVSVGLAAAYAPRGLGFAVLRMIEVLQALPALLLAVSVVAVLGTGLANTVIAIGLVLLPGVVRLTRAAAMQELAKDYATAARVAGASTLRLLFLTVLPNCLPPIIVQATMGFSIAILDTAALGFLGLSAQPPTPEWGTMLACARDFMQSAPWIVYLPGLAIMSTVLAINLIGDGLRDWLDPKLRAMQ